MAVPQRRGRPENPSAAMVLARRSFLPSSGERVGVRGNGAHVISTGLGCLRMWPPTAVGAISIAIR